MKAILKLVVMIWLAISFALTCFASLDADFCTEGGGIEHRKGFLVVQLADIKEGENGETVDQWGYPISGKVGDTAIMIFNPLTNYFDDVVARFDI